VKAGDVKAIGKKIGLKFNCDTANSFNLLTKEGRKELRAAGGSEVVCGSKGGGGGVVEMCRVRCGWWGWGWRVVVMLVLSYNSRGLGGSEKRAEIRNLVREKHPYVLCIQESKISVVDEVWIKSIWGDAPSAFSYKPLVGASGGLISVSDSSQVVVWSSMSLAHVLVIWGTVLKTSVDFVIINMYA